MEYTLIDFLIGLFLMNAMPHLVFGLLNIRFISAFGLSPNANLAYSLLNAVAALTLFHIQFGIETLMGNGIVIGAATVLLLYVVSGNFFYNLVNSK
ncbi:MAG: hypothetical protein QNJ45_17385 [Ardenticatenaceae bacterium]|nr:hypothetical protein [Ardenticatenaceae bacterium]